MTFFSLGSPSCPCDALINGLQMIGDLLTHLDINDECSLPLHDVLDACPNLVSFSTHAEDPDFSSSSPSTRYPKMTHLAIRNASRTSFSHDTTVDILKLFPSLLSLSIAPSPGSSVLTILHEHCPSLQVLHFGNQWLLYELNDVHPNRNGITCARLNGYGSFSMKDHLIQFLLSHRNSLEAFDFHGTIFEGNSTLLDGQVLPQQQIGASETSLTRLTNVRFSEHCSHNCDPFITWTLLNAPNLNAISLSESLLKPAVANAMIQSKNLSKLDIYQPWGDDEDDDLWGDEHKGIKAFLDYHIEMGNQSTLKELIIRVDGNTNPVSWMPLLPLFKCLQSVDIQTAFIHRECAIVLTGCSALERLTR